jgi:acyl-CoA reductase-like NAD-dependent aldehyde dehydrogenase
MTEGTLTRSVPDVLAPGRLFIGGEWQDAASGKTFEVIDPARAEVVTEVAEADAADMDRAVRAAREAFEGDWRKMTPRQRGRLIWKLAERLEERKDEIALVETLNNGKPLFESGIDVAMTIQTFEYYAGWATKIEGETIPVSVPYQFNYTLREPIGVVGAIVPWNFPLNLASWKVAPALAAGCTVILKPASETPLTALLLADAAAEVGFPPGVLNVVPGHGRTAGEALVAHPDVDKIAFTGSTAVGQHIARVAVDTVKRVSLELGGKSPNIVFADADLPVAAKGALNGIFYGKGEVCAAGSRLLVEESAHEQLVGMVAEGADGMKVGDPLEKGTRIGAVVSEQQMETVLGYIGRRRRSGRHRARLLRQAHRLRRRDARHDDRARGDLRAGSGDAHLRRRGGSDRAGERPRASRPERSGSTPTTSTTRPARSEATRRVGTAVIWAATHWSSTRR